MNIPTDARDRAEAFFNENPQLEYEEDEIVAEGQETFETQEASVEERDTGIADDEIELSELPIDANIIQKLQFHDVYTVEEYVNLSDEDFVAFGDFTDEERKSLRDIILQYVDIVEESEDELEEEYVCPNCGHPIKVDMTECPNCGTGLAFETVEESEE
jgi:N utilization substance protein A